MTRRQKVEELGKSISQKFTKRAYPHKEPGPFPFTSNIFCSAGRTPAGLTRVTFTYLSNASAASSATFSLDPVPTTLNNHPFGACRAW
jgi:hypothetical protein